MNQFFFIPIGLLPVFLFLAGGMWMDGYKLVPFRSTVKGIIVGGGAAAIIMVVHIALLKYGVSRQDLVRYIAPFTEELIKAVPVVYLICRHKVGFVVDAAILGFAVGAGFAFVENIYYLNQLEGAGMATWVARGFGTAVMHGSTTAMFAILSKGMTDRHNSLSPMYFLPGLLLAVLIHFLFNQVLINVLAIAFLQTAFLPPLLLAVFARSEKATRDWLGMGFDTDSELLELLHSGEFSDTRVGRYLTSLETQFSGANVGDMLCLIEINLELSMRAKGILMAREAGIDVKPDERVKANLKELEFLEKSIGKTGQIAIAPFIRKSRRDLWQLYMLSK